MRLEAMAVKFPHVEGHPNRMPFEGVLTVVDAASDKPPAGARGHRVVLTAGPDASELDYIARVKAAAKSEVVDLAGKLSLKEQIGRAHV